jgi:uroporphyrinogen-III synthase
MPSLEGKLIITTQPADQAGELMDLLSARGAIVLNLPMIQTRPVAIGDEDLKECLTPGKFQLLIFTSKKGVRGLFASIIRYRGKAWLPEGMKIAVTGRSTQEEVEKFGLKVNFLNPGTCAEDLATCLLGQVIRPGDNILLALGNRAPDFLTGAFSGTASTKRLDVYETIDTKQIDESVARYIREKRVDLCIFTSPSGFYNFLNFFRENDGMNMAAIGRTTASAIRRAGYEAGLTAPYPSPEALAEAVEDFFMNN